LGPFTVGVPKKRKKHPKTILKLLSKNNIYVTTLTLTCDQSKVFEWCESRVQPKNHIQILENVEKCEGMNSHTPKWAPILGIEIFNGLSNLQNTISKVKLIGLKSFLYHWKFFET
jgi:hypothetical protein